MSNLKNNIVKTILSIVLAFLFLVLLATIIVFGKIILSSRPTPIFELEITNTSFSNETFVVEGYISPNRKAKNVCITFNVICDNKTVHREDKYTKKILKYEREEFCFKFNTHQFSSHKNDYSEFYYSLSISGGDGEVFTLPQPII